MGRVERALRAPALPFLVAAAPIVVAVVRALGRSWIPVGDNAYFAIRARDVLTEHNPLVGAWSSGSAAVGVDVNNLGPLQLDLLAPFVRIFGFGPGTAVGVGAVNVAAVAVVAIFARRRLGALGGWLGAAMSTAVAWTLGSELLFEPRQHHALVLPFLALLVGVWSLLRGDRKALPVTALVASLLVQTHLTFAVPTIALSVVAVVGAVLVTWTDDAPDRWQSWRRPCLVTAAVLVACWAQPLVEELRGGQGNISALREAASAESGTLGLGRGARAVATVLAPPDGWWRPSFRAFDPQSDLMGPAGAAVALGLIAALLAGLTSMALQRRDRTVAAWLAAALIAVGVSVLAAATSPISGPFGAVSGNYRYLWPIAVFAAFSALGALLRLLAASDDARTPHRGDHATAHHAGTATLARRGAQDAVSVGPADADAVAGRRGRRRSRGRRGLPEPLAIGLVAAVSVAFALAAVPTSYQSPGPEQDAPLIPVARSLRQQIIEADVAGPVLLDRSGLFFGEPYSYVVMAALQESGTEIVFDAATDISRFGEGRRHDGPVRGTVTLVAGPGAREERPGSQLLARASSPDVEPDRGTVAVWLEPAR